MKRFVIALLLALIVAFPIAVLAPGQIFPHNAGLILSS